MRHARSIAFVCAGVLSTLAAIACRPGMISSTEDDDGPFRADGTGGIIADGVSDLPRLVYGDGGGTGTPSAPEEPAEPLPRTRGTLALTIAHVGSATARLTWPAVADATSIEVAIAPEPSAVAGEPLPSAIPIATLAGSATQIDLEGLAAAVDVFVRVEARNASGTSLWGDAHVRTLGGPRAELETALREVHAYGPSTLMLVLENPGTRFASGAFSGHTGAAWQGGAWTIERADGSAIGVRSVHRITVPVGQPDYPVGYERWGDENVVDLDHQIFLVLDQPIGERDVLRVRHSGDAATALDVRVPFSDRYLETPLIQVNQVGYNPRASRRWAYVYGFMGDGGSVDLSSIGTVADMLVEPLDPLAVRRAVTTGLPVTARGTADVEAGGQVREIDLATVPAAEGIRYRVRLPGVGVSWPTAVSEDAAFRSFWTTARGMFHNRWCGDLVAGSTEWSRPADHCSAFFVTGHSFREDKFPSSTPQTDSRPLRGGHHDAGDFDIRPYHVVVAQYLLRAVEIDTARFGDGQLALPESGNGIPDLLDEALWNVAAWQDLQNTDGSIRAGVESHAHPRGIHLANEDRLPYWTWDPEAWHTAYVAALFAQAARLVRPYDATRAAELERDARAAYSSSIFASAPAAYRLYAASEMFALTSDAAFRIDFENIWRSMGTRGAFASFNVMTHIYPGAFTGYAPSMADFVMGYATTAGADAGIVGIVRDELRRRADDAARAILESPHAHRNGRSPTDNPDWGHTTSTGRHADLLYQALQLGGLDAATQQRFFDAISVAADYVLGCNPAGLSYLTGLGTRSPQEPLHLDSLAFVKTGLPPVPGIPVYGPVNRLPDVYYYEPVKRAHYPAFDTQPKGLRTSDNRTAVVTSEFTVWEMQAPLTEMFATLIAPSMMPPPSWMPGGRSHRATLATHSSE